MSAVPAVFAHNLFLDVPLVKMGPTMMLHQSWKYISPDHPLPLGSCVFSVLSITITTLY